LKISAVVVTYKGLEFLMECIKGVRNQAHNVDQIIVVNNGGQDETAEWLSRQQDVVTINQENVGGAGGFYVGIKRAYDMDFDWVWCLDQDIEANSDTLSNLINSNVAKHRDIGFLTSLALFSENEIAYSNAPLLPHSYDIITSLSFDAELPSLCSSFGSVLISRTAIHEAGFPIREFFIWGDDTEFTMRIVELGFKGYLVINSKVYHKSYTNVFDPLLTIDMDNIRAKIGFRNKIYLIKIQNKLLYNSSLRGILSSMNYIVKVILDRLKKTTNKNFFDTLLIIKYSISGLFYNPRKYLEPEIKTKLKIK